MLVSTRTCMWSPIIELLLELLVSIFLPISLKDIKLFSSIYISCLRSTLCCANNEKLKKAFSFSLLTQPLQSSFRSINEKYASEHGLLLTTYLQGCSHSLASWATRKNTFQIHYLAIPATRLYRVTSYWSHLVRC